MGSKLQGKAESTLEVPSARAPFPNRVTQMVATSNGKIYGADLRLPSFESDAEHASCFELFAASLAARLGAPSKRKKKNNTETSTWHDWPLAGGTLTLHSFHYLDRWAELPERQVNVEFRKP